MRWDLVLVLRQLGGRVNATVGKRGCPRSGVGRVGVQGLRGGGERGWGRGKTNRHRSTVLPVASSPNSSVATCCARGSCTPRGVGAGRSEEHTSELQSLMRISYAVFCLKKKKNRSKKKYKTHHK